MRVFLAGATGVIGRRLIPLLVAGGHPVTAMTRQADRAGALRALGAEPLVADAYDRPALRAALAAARSVSWWITASGRAAASAARSAGRS